MVQVMLLNQFSYVKLINHQVLYGYSLIKNTLVKKQDMKTEGFIYKLTIISRKDGHHIKSVTTQFAVGRNRSVQVVRKQFPFRPAAAKTVHRSQGDNETEIVVNLNTRRAIPHVHYVD